MKTESQADLIKVDKKVQLKEEERKNERKKTKKRKNNK